MPMSTHNLIDLAHLEKYVAGDTTLRDEILSLFADRALEMCAALKTPQTDKERKLTLHTLKGGARGIGAWMLGDLCERAERIADAPGREDERNALIRRIDAAVNDVVAFIGRLREAA